MTSIIHFTWLSVILILVASIARRDRTTDAWIACGLMVCGVWSLPVVRFTTCSSHYTWDNRLALADRFLHLDSLDLARLVCSTRWLWLTIATVYAAMPLAVALVWVMERSLTMIYQLLAASVISPLLYLLVPATGPAYAFKGFPWSTPHLSTGLAMLSSHAPRNAFPSLHFTWALLLYVNAKGWTVKAFTILFALGTAIATVGSGEHYFVDLIAAVPFVLCLQTVHQKGGPE